MEVTVKKLSKPAIVYKIAPSGNSSNDHTLNHTLTETKWFEFRHTKLELEIQEFSRCGKCCQVLAINFRGELYSLRVLPMSMSINVNVNRGFI